MGVLSVERYGSFTISNCDIVVEFDSGEDGRG